MSSAGDIWFSFQAATAATSGASSGDLKSLTVLTAPTNDLKWVHVSNNATAPLYFYDI